MNLRNLRLTTSQERLVSMLVNDPDYEVFFIPSETAWNKSINAVRDANGELVYLVHASTVISLAEREILERVNDDPWVRIYKLRDLSNVLTP